MDITPGYEPGVVGSSPVSPIAGATVVKACVAKCRDLSGDSESINNAEGVTYVPTSLHVWAYSSIGRAPALHAGGFGFESRWVHYEEEYENP